MEPGRALADLVEISPQIEAVTVFGREGGTLGSVGVSDSAASALARAGGKLLDAAGDAPGEGGPVTRVHAAFSDGEVFAVAGPAAHSIVAVTRAGTAPGLVFYDLKRCLALLAEPEAEAAAGPRRRGLFRRGRAG